MDGGWVHGQILPKMNKAFLTWNHPEVETKTRDFIISYKTETPASGIARVFSLQFSFLTHLHGPLLCSTVDDLRDFRNGVFAHLSQASIFETDFQANVQLVSDAFIHGSSF